MSEHPTILRQFRSFCFRNNATNFEQAIDYFAVFGGMGWNVDLSKPIETVIEEKILDNYKYIHGEITTITKSNRIYHQILNALATGDRTKHSAFRNTKTSRMDGEQAVDFLVQNGILKIEKSQVLPIDGDQQRSDKILFIHPFMRFWFSSVSPYYTNIKKRDYSEFNERWNRMKTGFSNLVIQRLLMETISHEFVDDPLEKMGSYWDTSVEIDILAKTKSGRRIAGLCKFSKAKAGNKDLKKLQEDCTTAELSIDTFFVFSKNKFSNELKKAKSENLQLLSMRNLKFIMDNLDERDLITSTFKRY